MCANNLYTRRSYADRTSSSASTVAMTFSPWPVHLPPLAPVVQGSSPQTKSASCTVSFRSFFPIASQLSAFSISHTNRHGRSARNSAGQTAKNLHRTYSILDGVGKSDILRKRAVSLIKFFRCNACRERKVKCCGSWPCTYCTKRQRACVFTERQRKKLYPIGYVQALEEKVASQDCRLSPGPQEADAPHDAPASAGLHIPSSPGHDPSDSPWQLEPLDSQQPPVTNRMESELRLYDNEDDGDASSTTPTSSG